MHDAQKHRGEQVAMTGCAGEFKRHSCRIEGVLRVCEVGLRKKMYRYTCADIRTWGGGSSSITAHEHIHLVFEKRRDTACTYDTYCAESLGSLDTRIRNIPDKIIPQVRLLRRVK